MKLAGCLMLVSGWLIVLAALVVLPGLAVRASFAAAGVAVELIGLGLIARGQITEQKELQAIAQSINGRRGYTAPDYRKEGHR